MGQRTKIEWADHTFSPWLGCTKIAPGCQHCYAADMAGRLGVSWGPSGTRRRTAESTWRKVEAWNRQAGREHEAYSEWISGLDMPSPPAPPDFPRVFPSLCDPFEEWHGPVLGKCVRDGEIIETSESMDDIRRDFFDLIIRCPNLDFLLLTKRPENIRKMWGWTPGIPQDALNNHYDNIWLIYSASTQDDLERGLPHLLACRNMVPVLGLSLEPLLGPICLDRIRVDWVIVGGESGQDARPFKVEWARSIVRQCKDAELPCYVKQMGRNPLNLLGKPIFFTDPKGGDPDEWPADLRVQQFPRPSSKR
jgi:protein gp37